MVEKFGSIGKIKAQEDRVFDRGSGLIGVHITLLSLDGFADGEADDFRPHLSRSSVNLKWILGLVTNALWIGIDRRREAVTKFTTRST